MKKAFCLNGLFFCFLLVPAMIFGGSKGDSWQNRPLLKRSVSDKASQSQNNKKKNSAFKDTLDWCKKPAALYAMGGMLSAAAGVYAIFKYMQGDIQVLSATDKVENDSVIPTEESLVSEEKNNDAPLNDSIVPSELNIQDSLLEKEDVVIDKTNPIKVIIGLFGAAGVVAITAVICTLAEIYGL